MAGIPKTKICGQCEAELPNTDAYFRFHKSSRPDKFEMEII
jgi:hypothetical protein